MSRCACASDQLSDFETHDEIIKIIRDIVPFDDLEHQHIEETLKWIKSGVPIFRLQKPDIPPKHLASYFILFDKSAKKVLLVDHKISGLWLPSGGHVEPNEHPYITVERECLEELGIKANFWQKKLIFLTSTNTVGISKGHVDVNLWYILEGCQHTQYKFDTKEFNTVQWFAFDEIPYERSDIDMKRFISKLEGILSCQNISQSPSRN